MYQARDGLKQSGGARLDITKGDEMRLQLSRHFSCMGNMEASQ